MDKITTEKQALAAVQQYGFGLKDVPEAFKTEEICFAAVQNDNRAFRFVPDELKTAELCLTVSWRIFRHELFKELLEARRSTLKKIAPNLKS